MANRPVRHFGEWLTKKIKNYYQGGVTRQDVADIKTLLNQILDAVQSQKTQEVVIAMDMKDVQAKVATLVVNVAAEKTAEESAVALLKGLQQQNADIKTQLDLAIAANDPVALQAVADTLDAQNTEIANQTAALALAVATPPAPRDQPPNAQSPDRAEAGRRMTEDA